MSVYKGDKVVAGGSVDTYFVRKPAWSQAETVTIAQLNAGYTIPADGMLVGYVYTTQQGTPTKIMVNGVAIAIVYGASSDVSAGNFQTQVNQGDSVTVERNVTANSVAVSFVPFEDSTIAEPEVVTPELIRNMNSPDYTRGQAITLANTSASFTADKAYWVTYTNTYPLRINGVTVSSLASSANVNSFAGRIERGDVLTVAAGSAGASNLMIYPFKAQ